MDWRTHCFDNLGGIADMAGASLYAPFPTMRSTPTAAPAEAPAPAAPALTMTIVLADPAKPTLKLRYTNPDLAAPPAYWAKPTPDPSFTPRKGSFTAGAKPGEWEANIPLASDVLQVEIKLLKTLIETKNPHATPIARETIWFAPAANKGDAPPVMTTPPPDLTGELGVPYLDGAKLDALSEKRKKVIRDFLPMVTPSVVGSPAFDLLMTKAELATKVAELPNFTTCGTLTTFLSKQFNEVKRPKRVTIGGLIGCFWAAHDEGSHTDDKPAWVTAEAGLEPRPGDIFLITSLSTTPAFIKSMKPIEESNIEEHDMMKQSYPLEAFETLHVGVIVDTSPARTTAGGQPLWIVGEAGQGQALQSCLYDVRLISADNNGLPLMAGRRIAGWVDIDNYTPWT